MVINNAESVTVIFVPTCMLRDLWELYNTATLATRVNRACNIDWYYTRQVCIQVR